MQTIDRDEAVRDIALRLARHRNVDTAPRRIDGRPAALSILCRRRVPFTECAVDAFERVIRIDVANDDQRRGLGRKMTRMKLLQVVAGQPLCDLDRPFRRPAVRMALAIEQRLQGLCGANARVVEVLPDHGDHLVAPLRNLVCWKHRGPRHVGHERDHVRKVLGETGAREHHRVTIRGDPQRDAAVVEQFRDRLPPSAFVVPRSMTREHSHARPGRSVRLVKLPARTTTLIVTAGENAVCCTIATTPLRRTLPDRRQPAGQTRRHGAPAG